jgi:adenylosuccinate synthase
LGTGIGPRDIDGVLGVAKAYSTRVGEGPFPTELADATGDRIREQGSEYGTTTGRPRRCGWLDLQALRASARINSLSGIILTRLDVLDGFEEVAAATGYRLDGQALDGMPWTADDWSRVEPIWRRMPGWQGPLGAIRREEDLPAEAQGFIQMVEEEVGTPVAILSIGPDRDQTIIRRPDLVWG